MVIKKIFLLCVFSIYTFAFNIDGVTYDSFKADFNQKVTDTTGKTLVYEGKFYYKNENSLWQYLSPDKKRVYINKFEVMIVDDDLEQVVISKEQVDLKNILKNITLHKKDKNYKIYKAKYNDIMYYIYVNNDILTNISYKDELDNKVSIDFTNTKINTDLEDSLFKYEIPNNYDIIR